MFVFLSKKIAIPGGVNIHSLSWNSAQGWIACGGDDGMLRVLKLETSADSKARGIAAPSNLTMNQKLEGHQGSVVCCTWNANYRKLTTSDQYGLIIVWMLHRGMWFEEMINNRNKSVVRDMKWTADGQRICIAYADGAVIVGGVDGNRLWAKELGMELRFVEWSPDGRNILFSDANGRVYVFDSKGNKIAKLPLHAAATSSYNNRSNNEEDDEEGDQKHNGLIGIDWYDGNRGHVDIDAPDLCVAFANGKVQITKGINLGGRAPSGSKKTVREGKANDDDAGEDEEQSTGDDDQQPVLIDTGMILSKAAWNANGSVLALAGTQAVKQANGDIKKLCMVQFYTPFGQHLRTLKVPGEKISAFTWDGTGLRVAIAVDFHIYFANIRIDYRWGYFSNTLCYAYDRADRKDHSVIFWDTNSDERHTKYVKRLLAIRAAGENCVLATRQPSEKTIVIKATRANPGCRVHQYNLTLCNAIGSPVDTRQISIAPIYLAMTSTHVIAANEFSVYVWQYRTAGQSKLTSQNSSSNLLQSSLLDVTNGGGSNSKKQGRERVFHVDSDPSRVCVNGLAKITSNKPPKQKKSGGSDSKSLLFDILTKGTSDAITCIAASERYLVVGRESGTIHRYTLPHISLENKYIVRCRPQQIALNCNSTKLSIIDINGVLTFLDLEKKGDGNQVGEQLAFERKDAWDMLWAEDNPDLIAVMEKTRLYVFRGLEPEEPVLSSGYLCKHADLQIIAAMLDEIIQQPTSPNHDMIVDFPTKSLRDVREMLKTVSMDDAFSYIEGHSHPRLWKLLAEASLERLEFNVAEKAFVRRADYPGIQFVKRLRMLNDKVKQRAEVAAYFERFDEAESLYRDIDRKDLALNLRKKMGDWFRVVQLIQTGGGAGDDDLLREAWKEIGQYYASRQKWRKAVQYFASAKEPASLVECYYILEEFGCLEKLIRLIPEGNTELLLNIANKFQAVGMCEAACAAYLKAGQVKRAIDCCVVLNRWDQAITLAEQHSFPQIEGLLAKYASHLLEGGHRLAAIELYRKANKSTQAATLLANLAQEAARAVNPLGAKKLFVLSAMEMEVLRSRVLDTQLKTMGLKEDDQQDHDPDAEFELGTTVVRKPTRKGNTAMTAAQATAATLESLVQHDQATGQNRSLDNAWKGAEGYHLYLLAQRQLYKGKFLDALATSLQLRAYDDILDARDVYSLIALAGYYNQAWGTTSRAFIKLENLKTASKQDRDEYAKLALKIFTANAPVDPPEIAGIVDKIDKGRADGSPICMVSGKTIDEENGRIYKCRRCSRKMLEDHLRGINHCPLCHLMLV